MQPYGHSATKKKVCSLRVTCPSRFIYLKLPLLSRRCSTSKVPDQRASHWPTLRWTNVLQWALCRTIIKNNCCNWPMQSQRWKKLYKAYNLKREVLTFWGSNPLLQFSWNRALIVSIYVTDDRYFQARGSAEAWYACVTTTCVLFSELPEYCSLSLKVQGIKEHQLLLLVVIAYLRTTCRKIATTKYRETFPFSLM